MRLRLLQLLAIWIALGMTSASARQLAATLSGPSLGYLWSGAEGKLRPLHGILGNATIGDPMDLGFAITRAVALNGRHFLASIDDNPALMLLNMEKVPPTLTAVADAPETFSRIVGSRRGSAAALYDAGHQRVVIVTGLPSSPGIAHTIDVPVFGDMLTRMAVSDEGDLLVYSLSATTRDLIYGWTPASGSRELTTAEGVSDIALAANGDAIVADPKANEIFSILDPRGSAARQLLLDAEGGVSNPTGVIVSNANQLLLTNAGSQTIMTLDSTGRLLRTERCSCELAGLFPLRDSVYRLSDRTDQTVFLLEAGPSGDRVLFVPMLRMKK